jgi:hypothetical protein
MDATVTQPSVEGRSGQRTLAGVRCRAHDRDVEASFDGHIREWEQAGIISPDQADAIRKHEQSQAPAEASRLTTVAEVATYLGGVIAFVGGAAIIGPRWDDLRFGGQLILALTIAVAGFLAGGRLVALGEPGTQRLGWFLWVIGSGGAGLAAVVVTARIEPADDAWYAVVVGSTMAALGAGLWRNLDRPLQLLTTAGGSLALAAGLVELTDASVWMAAPGLQVAALAYGAWAAIGHVRPRTVALVTAAVGLMVGAFLYSNESEYFAAIAAVVSAVVIAAFALYDGSWPLVALGLLALFIAATSLMQTVVHGTAARLVVVVLGLLAVATVGWRAQLMRQRAG